MGISLKGGGEVEGSKIIFTDMVRDDERGCIGTANCFKRLEKGAVLKVEV